MRSLVCLLSLGLAPLASLAADVVVKALPLTPAIRNLLDAQLFGAMQRSALLENSTIGGAGIEMPKAPNPYRFVGGLITFGMLLLGSLWALWRALA
jgi:hypothetical protein